MRIFFGMATVGVLALVAAGCGGSTASGQTNKAVAPKAAQQQQFCQVLERGFAEKKRLQEVAIPQEPNPLKRDVLQKQFDQLEQNTFDSLYKVIGPGGQFEGWRGRLGWDHPERNGLINLSLDQICERAGYSQLLTGNSLVEPKGQTGVMINSPLGKTLIEIDPGHQVIASGRFIWARDFDEHEYDNNGPVRVCGQFHFYDAANMCHIPELSMNSPGVNLLVQFTFDLPRSLREECGYSMRNSIRCPACGTWISAYAAVCPNPQCGANIALAAEGRKRWNRGFGCLVFVLIGIGLVVKAFRFLTGL